MKELERETIKLKETIKKYKEVIEDLGVKIEYLPDIYRNGPILLEDLLKQYGRQLDMMQRTIKNPYFARIDFQSQNESNPESC